MSEQIDLVRKPAKVLESPDQTPVLFEFGVEDLVDASSEDAASRLSYLLSGPGVSDEEWVAVPIMDASEWAAIVLSASEEGGGGTSSISDGNDADFVWGLQLDDLDDGEYRLQVCLFAEKGL